MAALDKDTFDIWRQTDDVFKAEMREHIRTQHTINLDVERRVSVVEVTQVGYDKSVTKRTTWLSSIVAAIVGAAAGACGTILGR